MIKIKYECDETGQEMEILITVKEDSVPDENGEDQAEVRVECNPPITDDTKDPYGMMMRIFRTVMPKEGK